MPVPFYGLPALRSLAVFEAAARNGSFKEAGREFNVTPGAVSQQIRQLEEVIGAPLFLREGRGVVVTDAGRELQAALGRAFSDLSVILKRITNDNTKGKVVIVASRAVGAYYLAPRITEFWRDHPAIEVQPMLSDEIEGPLVPNVDLRISCGPVPAGSANIDILFHDMIVPVCSPAFTQWTDPDIDLRMLAEMPLIHVESPLDTTTNWAEWLRAAGYEGEIARGLTVESYTSAIQMAEAGAGVALGWSKLISVLIARGTLVTLGDWALPSRLGFYIEVPAGHPLSPEAQLLRDFLLRGV